MISSELIRRYPFFAGLNSGQIQALAMAGEEVEVAGGHVFFRETDLLDRFYLLLKGEVGIVLEATARGVKHGVAAQLTGQVKTEDMVVSAVRPGEVFGWSALFQPYEATAGAKALAPCKAVGFNAKDLLRIFEKDCAFGYAMAQKIVQVVQLRLRDRDIESLAERHP